MSASMPDRRRVSLAPVNTLAPSGTRSLTRVRAAAASSRISTAKLFSLNAAATRSRVSAGAGSVNDVAGTEVFMVPPELPGPLVMCWSHQHDNAAPQNVRSPAPPHIPGRCLVEPLRADGHGAARGLVTP